MRIDISMTREETKFTADRWWASSAEFVLHTLNAQLKAASVIFPELAGWTINPPPHATPDGERG